MRIFWWFCLCDSDFSTCAFVYHHCVDFLIKTEIPGRGTHSPLLRKPHHERFIVCRELLLWVIFQTFVYQVFTNILMFDERIRISSTIYCGFFFFLYMLYLNRLFQEGQNKFSHLMWLIFHTLDRKVDLAECHWAPELTIFILSTNLCPPRRSEEVSFPSLSGTNLLWRSLIWNFKVTVDCYLLFLVLFL